MEQKREVKVYLVEYKCPSCDKGNLYPTGNVLTTYPPIYPHKCSKCDYMENFKFSYPTLQYE